LVYKLPEAIQFTRVDETLELSVDQLKSIYMGLLARNRKKVNPNVSGMATIIQHEKVSLRSKMREITAELISKAFFRFSDFFSLKKRTKTEVVTGFMAVLELAKLKKVRLEQKKQFDDIMVYRTETGTELEFEEHIEVAELH
ncbi:MAG: segregation/condensation protein A, partial [Clostridiales bacterium]|nr:segregation/condensation protein A [Clostridiales bacterium]